MDQLALAVGCFLALVALAQALIASVFLASFQRPPRAHPRAAELPKAVILPALRGAPSNLRENLRRLLAQDYPTYSLHIVIDSTEDPAWRVVESVVAQAPDSAVQFAALKEPSTECSLKGSALSQMLDDLEEGVELVAMIDADVSAHCGWLRELALPFDDPSVGATHGNPWFMPQRGQWGSLVRYLWNAQAVVFMSLFGIVWGGSAAIRRSALERSGLRQRWKQSLSTDAPVGTAIRSIGLTTKWVPSLMMPNHEECELATSLQLIQRYMSSTRLYHRQWWPLVAHAGLMAFTLLLAPVLVAFALWSGRDAAVLSAGSGLAIFCLGMLLVVVMMEARVRQLIEARGQHVRRLGAGRLVKLALAIPLAQLIHCIAVAMASVRREVVWSGTTYRVDGPWKVRRVIDK